MLSEYVGVDVEALKALNPGVDLDFVFPEIGWSCTSNDNENENKRR